MPLCLIFSSNILIQLPPVIKNAVFRQYSKLDQSLFSRLVRLGVPRIILERQGRCRPEIASLFNWRYHTSEGVLGNLNNVYTDREYHLSFSGVRVTVPIILSRNRYFYYLFSDVMYINAVMTSLTPLV